MRRKAMESNQKQSPVSGDRISEAQFHIMLEFLELHPAMVQGYNNTREKRERTNRLWQTLASLLNGNRNKFRKGMVRSAKRWATYVSNYKCKLKKSIAKMQKGDKAVLLEFTDKEVRFMLITGLVQPSDVKNVNWDPLEEPSTSTEPDTEFLEVDNMKTNENDVESCNGDERNDTSSIDEIQDDDEQIDDKTRVTRVQERYSPVNVRKSKYKPELPRRIQQRNRPPQPSLTTILRLLKKQQASIDAQSRILKRLASISTQNSNNSLSAMNLIANNLGRLADAADRYVANHVRNRRSNIN